MSTSAPARLMVASSPGDVARSGGAAQVVCAPAIRPGRSDLDLGPRLSDLDDVRRRRRCEFALRYAVRLAVQTLHAAVELGGGLGRVGATVGEMRRAPVGG